MNKKTENNGGFKDYTRVFPKILDPPLNISTDYRLKSPRRGGGHKAFSLTLMGVMKILTKKKKKRKGVERAKKHSEGVKQFFTILFL